MQQAEGFLSEVADAFMCTKLYTQTILVIFIKHVFSVCLAKVFAAYKPVSQFVI